MRRPLLEPLEGRTLLAAVSFVIDPAASYLTVTARGEIDHVGDVKLKAQADGLDTARLQGTVLADVTSKGVRFNGGTRIDAIAHEGDFNPGDNDADLAVKGKLKKLGITLADLDAAIRDLELDVESVGRKKIKAQRRFDVRDASLEITRGTLDYRLDSKFGDADGSRDLAGLKDGNASTYGKITGTPGQRYLTMPIRLEYQRDFSNGEARFGFSGVIVAKESASASVQAVGVMPAAAVKKRVSAVVDQNLI